LLSGLGRPAARQADQYGVAEESRSTSDVGSRPPPMQGRKIGESPVFVIVGAVFSLAYPDLVFQSAPTMFRLAPKKK
jgi:hypothetical protein